MQEIMQSIVFVAAAILHGITGMGFPMLGTTALAFIMPLSKVVALVALPSLLMSLLVLCSNNKKGFWQEIVYYLKTYKLLAIGSVVGSILGVKLLLILPVSWLLLLMAIITLYYSVNGILNVCAKAKNIQVVANNKNMVLFGFLAGIIGGSTNAMSPILLIFLLSETENKNRIVKSSNLCYLLAKIVQIYMLRDQYWLLNKSEYGLIFLLSVLSVIGLYVGIRLRTKISPNFFKMLIFIVLLVLALKIGHSGLIKL
ncbi:TPA: sulfite exporter TauE/SafE family protein [Neisseria meningitidis]|jgi:Predicted permeases|uniref:Probable membrane transporter protein n=6 Tax=Neisseria meningitidis TaxID=487 RepID=Q9K0V6_NEIMB|nr:sulfite exporter TauE/SafE family protein [Neisseria meningitidis]ELL17517.1 sulfite exporter TauE/SafE family protein [Neisseria meningitidis 61103]EOC14397.1 sulfite exporter TauE/SafE family protein [Neisseria meningitidis 73696]EQD08480.1 sulfite exporter TauE/SafE family protein [Neisseria meningitidis NM151]EQD15071.1 sulfite exporter TauE/SafE family protein [Neisseria meningitidis NM0552]CCA44029.1 permease [Neisseria meningitidis alpha522]